MNELMSVEDIRMAARLATYRNRHEEDENVRRVDREVWDRVALYEAGVVQAARAHVDRYRNLQKEADDLETTIRRQIRFVAESEDITPQFAQEFERLRLRANALAESLGVAERQARWHVGRCNDIYGSYLALVARFPSLRPQIRVQ